MKIFRLILVLILFSVPAYAQDAVREKAFNAESFTLENGMRVVVIPNHRVPAITHMVWYGVGSADEDLGQSGLAHFVEHLMFKGSENVPPGEFSKRVRALGGNDNAFTSQDYTAYFQSIAAENLETVMKMEADRINNLTFPPEEVDSELKVVLEERRERTENDPTGYFYEQMRSALFVNHPYGDPVIGWLHEMKALSRENVMDFYKTWYAPNNAILIVAGDMSAEKFKPLAEKIYGVLPAETVPERVWTEVPPLLATQRLTLHHPSIRQPELYRIYRVPSMKQNKQDSLALELLAAIMSDGQNSRLYKSLVVEQKIATSADMGYSGSNLSDSTLQVSVTPAEGVTLEKAEEAIDAELAKLVTSGVTPQELSEAVTRLRDAYIFARDSLQGPAMVFGHALITGSTIDDVEYWAYDIGAVTVEQVNDVARRFLDADNMNRRPFVTGYILPEEPEEKPQEEKKGT